MTPVIVMPKNNATGYPDSLPNLKHTAIKIDAKDLPFILLDEAKRRKLVTQDKHVQIATEFVTETRSDGKDYVTEVILHVKETE